MTEGMKKIRVTVTQVYEVPKDYKVVKLDFTPSFLDDFSEEDYYLFDEGTGEVISFELRALSFRKCRRVGGGAIGMRQNIGEDGENEAVWVDDNMVFGEGESEYKIEDEPDKCSGKNVKKG